MKGDGVSVWREIKVLILTFPFSASPQAILSYLRASKQPIRWPFVKLMLLGDNSVGKTSFLRSVTSKERRGEEREKKERRIFEKILLKEDVLTFI